MINVDDRIGSVELAKYFPKELVNITRLEFGDFSFPGNGPDDEVLVGIERKAIRDLVDSMKSGRLWGHQIPGMVELYDYVYLIVEGVYKVQPDYMMVPCGKRWRRLHIGNKAMDPYLNTIQVLTGCILRETNGKKHTAQLIYHLYKWWQKPFEEHGSCGAYQRPIRLPDKMTDNSLVYKVSQVLPGIGQKRGLQIKDHFSSVIEMINASEAEWLEVPDIGMKTAKTIREALGY